MTLSPGTRLGPYEITSAIGAGGMGEVYRARDTKLNRDVAIKVLPESFASDPERLARFTREAQTLASLNHPNIAAIYSFERLPAAAHGSRPRSDASVRDHPHGSESRGGEQVVAPAGARGHRSEAVAFLVMELVEGEDLSAHIARGPIPIPEVLPISRQIAEALEAAHEHGIIHRDLKPGNIKVRSDGTVKVLDFGLAKAMESAVSSNPDVSHSPTLTGHGTQLGMIIGTAAYMSPEQARGKPVDKRADIWAFGVVLYEMLTGTRAFKGDDVSETLASVLKDTLSLDALPAGTPPRLRRLIGRCLDRDLKTRLRDIGEARVKIANIQSETPESGLLGTAAGPTPPAPTRRVAPLVIATAAVTLVATLGLTRWLMPVAETTNHAPVHVSVALPEGDEMGRLDSRPLAVSSDRAHVAYVGLHEGTTRIYLHTLSDGATKALDGSEGGDSPFFSPDGRWIAFFAGSKLRKVAVGGAGLQTLADAPSHRGGDWGGDGYIYFAPTTIGGIWRVPEGGGTASEVTHKDPAAGEISHRWPQVLGSTNTLLFGAWTGPGDDESSVAIQTIGGGKHHALLKGGDAPRYAAIPGVLLYCHVSELFAVPWRPPQVDLGRAVPVAMPEHPDAGGFNEGQGNYDVSEDGTLAYIAGGRAHNAARLAWIDRAGKPEWAPLPERNYENAILSPDGKRAIVQIREGTVTLWMYEVARKTLTPFGASVGSSQAPVWTPDGKRVIYRATRKGLRNLYWRLADGSGDEEPLASKPDVLHAPTSVSPDGRWLLFNENGALEIGGIGIWVMRLDGDRKAQHLFPQPAGELDGQFSPDGRWIAYQATVSSRQEIFVAPFPGPGPRHQVSTDGGVEPLWTRDGRELLFQSGARLMGAAVTLGGTFSASTPRPIYEGRFLKSNNAITSWSITPDGKRFLRIQQVVPERAITRIDLVLNWFEELRAKGPSR